MTSLKCYSRDQGTSSSLSQLFYVFKTFLAYTVQNLYNMIALNSEQDHHPYSKLDDDVRTLLSSPDRTGNINISHGRWGELGMTGIIDSGQLTLCVADCKLYLGDNKQPRIIDLLSRVSFPYLKQVNIWGNLIESLQNLSRVYFPNLTNFALNVNLMTEVRGLRKCHWPALKSLGLSGNKFRSYDGLSEMNCGHLIRLVLSFQVDQQIGSGWAWIAKMEGSPHSVYAMSDDQIGQQRVEESLKRRNPLLGIRK